MASKAYRGKYASQTVTVLPPSEEPIFYRYVCLVVGIIGKSAGFLRYARETVISEHPPKPRGRFRFALTVMKCPMSRVRLNFEEILMEFQINSSRK